ncbi:aminotransferase class V-fold PLP-dependent enzyme [Hoeflea sp. WL0058]|uniref:Aminotransferase class V-fold PLP-dependent enzyme n=1 Tax=Flavimaribacter sediminis TaxID=2865987 RepID=A0AAE2ZJT3_9HYPH|nr:aminotransferase class V-fold PLP-dependent enzyme [Flavimaribacter sediminis]MBW8637304.1 aminotransferase class V-fold PLP-dependent enzyme [Flavimaribacter sediminis]
MRISFPEHGLSKSEVLASMQALKSGDIDWKRGRAPLYVFDGGEDVYEMGRAAFFEFFKENALGGRRAFPSVLQMEEQVVGMAIDLLHGDDDVRGFMTTGGTESIIQAVQSARDYARSRGRTPKTRFNIVAAASVHPAFNKAARLMDLDVVRTPVDADLRADPDALARAIDDDTIMIVGSAPCFPYGVIDLIEEIGRIAQDSGVWMHVDACVGGYVAPFAAMIGRDIPAFDFAVPGVCSISADLHKFGFCPKPASTVFYRDEEHARHHAFDFDDWPNGRFYTNTICGTRPAGGVAAAWAVFNHLGLEGYKLIATELMDFIDLYKKRISEVDGLEILGKPHLSIVAYKSGDFDIYAVAEKLKEKGWLPGLVRDPKAIHQMMSLVHGKVFDEYIADVEDAVASVKSDPSMQSELKATY